MTEIDYLENEQKVINTQKNFNELIPRYFSNKTTYSPDGLNRINFDSSSFIVDWQLKKNLNP